MRNDRPQRPFLSASVLLAYLFYWSGGVAAAVVETAEVEKLFLTGRVAEARQRLESVKSADLTADQAILLNRVYLAAGEQDQAKLVLESARKRLPTESKLNAVLGLQRLAAGDLEGAQQLAKAVQDAQRSISGEWLAAELARVQGRYDKAEAAYERIIKLQVEQGPTLQDPFEGLIVGLAMAQVARWQRKSQLFSELVNKFYPALLEQHPQFWPAHLEMARLFMEKYNEPDAKREITAGLVINPHAADLHAASAQVELQSYDLTAAEKHAQRAVQQNKNCQTALWVLADLAMTDQNHARAIELLERARAVSPINEEGMGRLVGAQLLKQGLRDAWREGKAGMYAVEVEQRNPDCGEFYSALADTLDRVQRFPAAEKFYRESLKRHPRLTTTSGKLGLTLMRLGEEKEATQLLNESFDIDPFNIRVKNMLAVLEVLQGYAVIETEHFVIRFDRGQDQLLAEFAARYLEEEVYPEIVEQLGYEPPGKSLFEIFNKAQGNSGHRWFSTRMVGLPFIGTVGACAGKIVAITSPNSMPQKFNWARVLKHEFVHVVNLQQSNFNIPRWFTEGLAVWYEDLPRKTEWSRLLVQRHRAGKLYDLSNINFAFARPNNQDDWTLAYCQGELYVEFIIAEFGNDKIGELIAGYAEGLTTRQVVEKYCGLDVAAFEAKYTDFVTDIVGNLASLKSADIGKKLSDLQRMAREEPENADALAELALAYSQRKSNPLARRYALLAQKQQKHHPLAGYVLARLYLSIGDAGAALEQLEPALDEDMPHPRVLGLLAALRVKQRKFEDATRLYKLGVKHFAGDDKWTKSLAQVYLLTKNETALQQSLQRLAEQNADNVTYSKKLSQLALKQDDLVAAEKWAKRVLEVDIRDADMHATVARGRTSDQEYERALPHWKAAVQLVPEPDWMWELAQVQVALKRQPAAQETLRQLLEVSPRRDDARKLLEKLDSE